MPAINIFKRYACKARTIHKCPLVYKSNAVTYYYARKVCATIERLLTDRSNAVGYFYACNTHATGKRTITDYGNRFAHVRARYNYIRFNGVANSV